MFSGFCSRSIFVWFRNRATIRHFVAPTIFAFALLLCIYYFDFNGKWDLRRLSSARCTKCMPVRRPRPEIIGMKALPNSINFVKLNAIRTGSEIRSRSGGNLIAKYKMRTRFPRLSSRFFALRFSSCCNAMKEWTEIETYANICMKSSFVSLS